jgi:hypothetical protein
MTGLHRKRKRTTSTEQYTAMLHRMISAYGTRIGEEPATGLAHLRELETALTDAANLGIYTALQSGQSPTILANMLGASRPTIYKRAELGAEVARERERHQRAKRSHVRDLPIARHLNANDLTGTGRQTEALPLGGTPGTPPSLEAPEKPAP